MRLPAAAPTRAVRGRTSLFVLLVLACAGALAPRVSAQEPGDIVTDRPDETESPFSVAPGNVQIEMGWSYVNAYRDGSERRTHQVPGTLAAADDQNLQVVVRIFLPHAEVPPA